MSMTTTRIITFWNPGEAHDVIQLLDVLRNQLWESYGDQIIAMQREGCSFEEQAGRQYSLDLEDEGPF